MKYFKKVLLMKPNVTLGIFIILSLTIKDVSAGTLAADYLMGIGKSFYEQGRFEEALREFKKVLMIEPDNTEAINYIKILQTKQELPISSKEKITKTIPTKKDYLKLDSDHRQKAMEHAIKISEELTKVERTLSLTPVDIEELPEKVVTPSEILQRKGQIGLFINSKEVFIDRPILVKDGKVFVPLKEIVSKLYFSLLDLKEGNFKIVSSEGKSQVVKASFINGEAMISEEEIRDYFSVDTYFDAAQKVFNIYTKSPLKLHTYLLEKPEEEFKKEIREAQISKEVALVPDKPTIIPVAARPSIELKGNTSYTYIDYHVLPTYHSFLYSLRGRAYDFDLSYETNYKDISGVFDHSYSYLNLSQPGLFMGFFDQITSLSPLRLQSQTFNGLKLIKGQDNLKTTFVGGDTENFFSGTSGSVKYTGRIYGLMEDFSPLEWLGLRGAIFYLENKADKPNLSGTTTFPRNNLVSFAEARLKLPYNLTVSSQLANSHYHPDNASDTSISDWDWRIASDLKKDRYNIGLAYEFVGDQYASLGNPLSYQDYSGWNLYGNYKVTDKWTLFSSLMRFNNNVADDPNRSTQDNFNFTLSSYYRLPKEQGLTITYNRNRSDSITSVPTADHLISTSNLYRIDYSLPLFFNMRGLLNYQYFRTDSTDINTNDYYSQASGIALFKSFAKGSSWYINQQFIKTYDKTNADNLNSNTSFNLNYVISDLWSLYFNSSYSRDKTEQVKANNTLSSSTGFNYRIFPTTTLRSEYNINSYNLNTEKGRWPRNWSIMGYISQDFNFSTPPNFGIIQGAVIKDDNGNNRVDSGEVGLEAVRLYLDDRREKITNKDGNFKFSYVTPGIQSIHLDLASLPIEFTTKNIVQEVNVKPRKKSRVTFLIIKASSICGKVFIDENSDLTFQENEEPLENVAVIMVEDEQFRRTNSEGDFKFDELLPGKYKLRINPQDIPLGYELVSQAEIEVELLAGEDIKDINFILHLTPSTIKKF